MNRRAFHKTLITGAGMSVLPVWAVSLPTPEDLLCGHELRLGVRCERERGHEWEHRKFHSRDDAPKNEIWIHVYEWNDERAEWKFDAYEMWGDVHVDISENSRVIGDPQGHVEVLKQLARMSLKPGQVFELRAKTLPDDGPHYHAGYARKLMTRQEVLERWGMAWYWKPPPDEIPRGFDPRTRCIMEQTELFELHPLNSILIRNGGYRLFGRCKA